MNNQKKSQTFAAYTKRQFKYQGIWTVSQTKLKVYTITSNFWNNRASVDLQVVRDYVVKHLPLEIQSEGSSAGLGFVVVHFGNSHIWLLMHWWAHGEICCQRMSHSEVDQLILKSVDDRALHACVWENKVINHEHEAWIKTMLAAEHTQTSEQKEQAYLNNILSDGAY